MFFFKKKPKKEIKKKDRLSEIMDVVHKRNSSDNMYNLLSYSKETSVAPKVDIKEVVSRAMEKHEQRQKEINDRIKSITNSLIKKENTENILMNKNIDKITEKAKSNNKIDISEFENLVKNNELASSEHLKNLEKKVILVEKEKISLNVLREALATDFPTELINKNNRKTYLYFINLLLASKSLGKLSAKQQGNLLLLSKIYGFKKLEVVF